MDFILFILFIYFTFRGGLGAGNAIIIYFIARRQGSKVFQVKDFGISFRRQPLRFLKIFQDAKGLKNVQDPGTFSRWKMVQNAWM